MQPIRPHGHVRPSLLTTMWPISPAPPRPSHSSPSSTMPPPTPVPQKTPSSDRNGLAAPSSNSACVATLTSLESAIGAASAASSFSAERVRALPVGQVARARDRSRPSSTAGRADADGGQAARADAGLLARLAHRGDHRERHVGGAARRGRRVARRSRAPRAARPPPPPGSSCRRGRCRRTVPLRSSPTRSPAGPLRPRCPSEPYGRKRAKSSSAYQRSARVRRITSRWSARAVGVGLRVGLAAPEREGRLACDGPFADADRREQPGRARELRRGRLDRAVEARAGGAGGSSRG